LLLCIVLIAILFLLNHNEIINLWRVKHVCVSTIGSSRFI
jgi:hypothetical protein